MKKLNLKKESLAELATDDLHAVVGGTGTDTHSCPTTFGYTMTCTCPPPRTLPPSVACTVSETCTSNIVKGGC